MAKLKFKIMANASRDQNTVPTLLGALETNGTTIVPIEANPTTHALEVNDNVTGSDHGPTNAPRDQNFVPVLMAISETDGVTPVVIYASSTGELLVDST